VRALLGQLVSITLASRIFSPRLPCVHNPDGLRTNEDRCIEADGVIPSSFFSSHAPQFRCPKNSNVQAQCANQSQKSEDA
jgi:hypothetical protein